MPGSVGETGLGGGLDGSSRGIYGAESAKIQAALVAAYLSSELPALCRVDATLSAQRKFSVCSVLRATDFAEIGWAIVAWVAVNVIDFWDGIAPVHHLPNDTVGSKDFGALPDPQADAAVSLSAVFAVCALAVTSTAPPQELSVAREIGGRARLEKQAPSIRV